MKPENSTAAAMWRQTEEIVAAAAGGPRDGEDAKVPARWALIVLAIIPLWIMFGNMLVLLAVITCNKLRTLSNWVIASLAATDFLLALVVLPPNIYQLVSGN